MLSILSLSKIEQKRNLHFQFSPLCNLLSLLISYRLSSLGTWRRFSAVRRGGTGTSRARLLVTDEVVSWSSPRCPEHGFHPRRRSLDEITDGFHLFASSEGCTSSEKIVQRSPRACWKKFRNKHEKESQNFS